MENDRRVASDDYIRALLATVQDIVPSVHIHDKDIAILKIRMDSTDDRLSRIETDVRETKTGVQAVLDRLTAHTIQEDKDRQKLLMIVISTLISVLVGIAVIAKDIVLSHI